MLPSDTFRARFDQLIASLRAWTGFIADVARVEVADSSSAWRIAIVPHVAEGCPAELLLRRDQQFDLAVGPETYEDLALDDWSPFQPLLEAIAEGHVVTRTLRSASTGALHSIETIVEAGGQRLFHGSRADARAAVLAPDALVVHDRAYAPYRR